MFNIISAWFLGIFTQSFLNDSQSIALCRMDLIELESLIERLRRAQPHRKASCDADALKEIKKILRIFSAHYAGLSIKLWMLEELIQKSLKMITDWEVNLCKNDEAVDVGVNIGNLWGYVDRVGVSKIKEINSVLYRGFFFRLYFKIKESLKKIKL